MQSLDVISVNIWHILISLINLVLLFLVAKRFLFKPVKKLFAEREAALEHRYAAAKDAQDVAEANKAEWERKLSEAEIKADEVIKNASDIADMRAEQIVDEAKRSAEDIMRRAEAEAELTRKKAEDGIKQEIAGVSVEIAQKLLEREINEDDHRAMISEFIKELDRENDTDK